MNWRRSVGTFAKAPSKNKAQGTLDSHRGGNPLLTPGIATTAGRTIPARVIEIPKHFDSPATSMTKVGCVVASFWDVQ